MTAPSPPDLRLLGLRPGTVPELQMGDDLAGPITDVLPRTGTALQDGDIVVIASNAVSIAEKRYVDLGTVIPGLEAQELVGRTGKPAPARAADHRLRRRLLPGHPQRPDHRPAPPGPPAHVRRDRSRRHRGRLAAARRPGRLRPRPARRVDHPHRCRRRGRHRGLRRPRRPARGHRHLHRRRRHRPAADHRTRRQAAGGDLHRPDRRRGRDHPRPARARRPCRRPARHRPLRQGRGVAAMLHHRP